MNIFVLSFDPYEAAIQQCDKHVVKMVLESAQMLSMNYPLHYRENGAPIYKRSKSHYNHPCTIWARESRQNFKWLLDHAFALGTEYTYRYGKRHKSMAVLDWIYDNNDFLDFPDIGLTPFALAMPEEYQCECPVESYREFYKGDKARFAKWAKTREAPDWWQKFLERF